MGIWKNAFKLPETRPPDDGEKYLLTAFAGKVKRRSLGDTAALALEATRPFHNLSAQALVFLMPFISYFFRKEDAERVAGILENPKAVDFFIEALNNKAEDKK